MTLAEKLAAAVGIVLHLAFGVFPFAASGLVAPLWGVAVLYVWWLALAYVIVRLLRGERRRPLLVPLVPLVALAGWFTILTVGEAAFGWTA